MKLLYSVMSAKLSGRIRDKRAGSWGFYINSIVYLLTQGILVATGFQGSVVFCIFQGFFVRAAIPLKGRLMLSDPSSSIRVVVCYDELLDPQRLKDTSGLRLPQNPLLANFNYTNTHSHRI